jgi:protein involved in polysaccharide export with SLBB domain
MPSPFRPSPGPAKGPNVEDLAEAFDIVCRNYRLGPGDVLRTLFVGQWDVRAGNYKLAKLDQINVEFILDPDLNRLLTIRPDGMITLPGIGEVKAEGMRPADLASVIERRFREANIFRASDNTNASRKYKLVTVSVVKINDRANELIQAITAPVSGQNYLATVKPDGTIDMPVLKERIMAAGHSVPEVERTVNRLYRRFERRYPVASISLDQAKSRKVYVLGEVNMPGAYDITQPITALHALALAQGHKAETADLTSVILISKNIYGKPIGRRLDLKRMLDVGDMSSAILVKPYDVLYVPKTYIRDLRLFMEQYFATVAEIQIFANRL